MRIGLREIIFFVLLLCIPLSAWLAVFKPNNAKADETGEEIQKMQHNLTQKNLAAKSIATLEKDIASLEEAMNYFKSKLPSQRQMPTILKEISNLVTANKLKLVSIRPANKSSNNEVKFAPTDGAYAEQTIEVRVEGDFMDFYLFLQALESLPRITRVQKLEVEGSKLNDIKAAQKALSEGEEIRSKQIPIGHVIVNFKMSIFFERSAG